MTVDLKPWRKPSVCVVVWAVVLAACTSRPACAQPLPFFPGAEGYGGAFAGSPPPGGWFSNATVYHVTNLNDSGPGSFRNAFVENSSNKIIIFDVAGTIELSSDNIDIKNLSNYYIAGQTAPGPVTIYGRNTQLTHSSNKENRNVVLRYLSFRKGSGDDQDALGFAGSGLGTHMILDHVSASWSEDEVLSVANNNTNLTVQYSIIHDALVSNHAYGSLIRPRIDSEVTFHHNLYANNASRQARFGTYNGETLTADFRNNVIYNWRDRASYAGGSSEDDREYADVNYVGNYLVAGPGTQGDPSRAFSVDRNIDVRAYQSGNFIDSDRLPNPGGEPNGNNTGWGMFGFGSFGSPAQTLTQMNEPFATPPVTTQSALDAYWQVINHVGNYWWDRDEIDARVIGNVLDFTNPPGGIAANNPPAAELNYLLNQPITFRNDGWDIDGDGMPGAWEREYGLDPEDPNDWNLDFDNDGYINLIEYINEAGEFPAPTPLVFDGSANNRYASIFNWKTDDGGVTSGTYWQPSRFDQAHIRSGTAVVDAVGQHAGGVQIGEQAGQPAALHITDGWLKVHDAGAGLGNGQIVIGAGDSDDATLQLSGGTLQVKTLSRGAGGSFEFTGGKLQAGEVDFDLEVHGGTVAPGSSIGTTTVHGNATFFAGSSLEIEFDEFGADLFVVNGDLLLDENVALDVLPLDETASGSFLIATYTGTLSGTFGSVTDGYTVDYGTPGEISLLIGNVLAGDYNNDGLVNSADYVVWRNSLTGGVALQNETASPGIVDQADYDVWRANFGSAGTGHGVAGQAVPEPAASGLITVALAIALGAARRK